MKLNRHWLVPAVLAVSLVAGCSAEPSPAPPPGTTPPSTTEPAPTTDPPPPVVDPPPPGVVDVPAGLVVTGGKRSGDQESVTLPGGKKFPLYSNYPLAGSDQPTRALIVVHGTGRNAEGYFERAMDAAKDAGDEGRTLIVAPHFIDWSSDAWKSGDGKETGDTSSFAVADELIATLSDRHRFPNIREIVLTGHSAGGQFTQRYAAFGNAPGQAWADPVSFVVMNPSSYVWLVPTRPAKTCSGFNDYKYGLDARSGYVGRLTAEEVLARFTSRHVVLGLGDKDTYDNGDMDKNCEAMAQGPHRFARGQNFAMSLPNDPNISVVVVPGVEHESDKMLAATQLRGVLFGMTDSDG